MEVAGRIDDVTGAVPGGVGERQLAEVASVRIHHVDLKPGGIGCIRDTIGLEQDFERIGRPGGPLVEGETGAELLEVGTPGIDRVDVYETVAGAGEEDAAGSGIGPRLIRVATSYDVDS